MANTYSQIYVHIVFAVKGRVSLIPTESKVDIHKYITGIVKNKECKMFVINSMPDHLHTLIGLNPKVSISDLVRDIKSNSTAFIKQKIGIPSFAWQEGYGAFSYSRSQRQNVIQYIEEQEKHHQKKTFREEYMEFLKAFDIPYDERCVFDEPE